MSMKERACSHCVDGWTFVAPSYALQFPDKYKTGAASTVTPCEQCIEGRERAFSLNYAKGADTFEYRRREIARKAREAKV